jgi:hypothetical protein
MNFWRKTARYGAAVTGIVLVLFGAFVCFRNIERYYYAYLAPATDDLTMRHVKVTWEIGAWAVAVAFVISGLILLRLAKTFMRSN